MNDPARTDPDLTTDAKLLESLLRQQAILDNIPDIAWLKDRESRFIAVNGPFGEACGRSPADLVGRTDYDIWPRDLAESYRDDDAEVMRTGKRKRVEERLVGPDGRESWIETIKTPIVDKQGNVIGTTGIARNITERRQAEARLRNVTRLYAFLSQINQAIVRTRDRDELFRAICRVAIDFGRFRMAWIGLVNETSGIVLPVTHAGQEDGYLRALEIRMNDNATGKGPTGTALSEGTLTICDDIATDPRMLPWRDEALKRGYRSSAAIPFRQKEKVIGSLNLYAEEPGFFTDEEQKLLAEIGVDITYAVDNLIQEQERKLAEEALFESKERYQSFFENAAVAVAVVDRDGRVVEANDADCRFLGYSRTELVGMHFSEFTHPQDLDLDTELYRSLMNGERKGYEIEKRYVRKDGVVVWGRLAISLIHDRTGTPRFTSVICSDITDRKRAEEALRESEERYRTLFETMAQGVVYQAADGRIISANSAAERILGVSIDQMQGRTSLDPRWRAIREDGSDFSGDRHPAMEALRTGRPVHNTIMGVFHPGRNEYRWILVSAVPEFISGETRPYQVYATFTDITDRRRAEEGLRESEARMRAIIERAPFGAHSYELQPDGRLILSGANHAANRILSLDHSRLIGKTIEEAFPGLVGTDIPDTYRRIAATGAIHETDNVVYERDHIHGAFAIHAFQTGPQRMTVFFQDITERKKSEHALRESEERLRLALSAAKQGLYDLNVQTGQAIVSPEYSRMLGHAPEEFIETNAKWIERLHPDDRAPVAETYRAYVSGALPEYRVEFRQRTKSGEWKWILSVGKIVEYDASGKPLRMLGTHTDITDRKRAEQERLDLERRLLHAQKLESLGVLAGGIAHDFNNLLMAVLGNLDLALRKVAPDSPARLNIEHSAQAARRATDLTRQMLAYSGRGSFIVKAMDLSDLVEENAHLLRSSVARTATLEVLLSRSLPSIEADAGQVQQVIMNLITNASEAIGDASGTITITTGTQECDAQTLKQSRNEDAPPPGRFVYLEVSDTGCGMDEQTKQRLFDPFFTTKAPGRGLGMSAILGIVRGHRGAVFVESSPGRGTTIRILFPALEGSRVGRGAPARERAAGDVTPAVNGKVLVVDDEEIVRRVSKEMVEALGLPVLTAVDGRDAVDMLTKHAEEIAVVILDLSMPNMDGMTAFQELVRIRPGVKVILSSGYDELDSIKRLSGQGLAGFIQKPYSLTSLREALKRAGAAGA